MPRITNLFKIADLVPFVDIDPTIDTRLFADAHRIRLQASTGYLYTRSALDELDSFSGFIAQRVMAGDLKAAFEVLKQCGEPNETRLGMSSGKIRGRGAADELAQRITDAMADSPEALLELGLFSRLENLPLYVEGIDSDITSDVTTRVIFGTLIDFTLEMVFKYPQLGQNVRQGIFQVWDSQSSTWQKRTASLPFLGDSHLVLVPSEWVGKGLLISSDRYYGKTVLDWVQAKHTTVMSDGRVNRPPKWQLQERKDYKHSRMFNLQQTLEAAEVDINLIDRFMDYVAEYYWLKQDRAA